MATGKNGEVIAPPRPSVPVTTYSIHQQEGNMHLFETEEGDKWVCVHCRIEEDEAITAKGWEWLFDRHDQTLSCALCGHGDEDTDD